MGFEPTIPVFERANTVHVSLTRGRVCRLSVRHLWFSPLSVYTYSIFTKVTKPDSAVGIATGYGLDD
jgi:hypothetical protein